TTSTTSTTSTTTSTTSTTKTTSTTSTTSTTTTAYDSCKLFHANITSCMNVILGLSLRWNQTGTTVAGGSSGSGANQFNKAAWVEIDENDTMYVADHHGYRVQKYVKGATSGVTVVDAIPTGDHPESITFDKDGYMYMAGHTNNRVIRYPPNSGVGTNVAGRIGSSTTALTDLSDPLGMDLDDNLNLYIAERKNKRVVKWARNAAAGTIVIGPSSTSGFYGILLSLYSSNQAYVSSEETDSVYLWTFGASSPSVTLTQVNATTATLNAPRGMEYDTYGNLYVVDRTNKRVVMYCVNSTVGKVVAQDSTQTSLDSPLDLAFDSDLNLYVVDDAAEKVVKYTKL
ncbi:unnamed protein product, partial [Rotaria sp. Silwood2]